MSKPLIGLAGQKFGKLTAIRYRSFTRQWLCECECGGEKYVRGHALTQGKTRSCGCLQPRKKPTRKLRTKCPCCGQQLASPIVGARNADLIAWLSVNEQSLFNLLKECPNGLTNKQIHERIFHTNRWGEPSSRNIVPTVTRKVNEKIAPWGMKIKTERAAWDNMYWLVQL